MITAFSLPFLAKKPIDLPPIVSVELIQITDKTNIPYAPKAKKIIEKIKEKEKKLVSEQAPPKKVKKIKPDAVPMPDDKPKKVEKIKEDKQNPEKIELSKFIYSLGVRFVGQINAKLIASAFSNIKSFISFFEGKSDILSTLENTDGLGPKVIQSFIEYSSIKSKYQFYWR